MKYGIGFIIGVISGLVLLLFFITLSNKVIDAIKVISFLFVGLSAILALIQLRLNLKQSELNTEQIRYTNEWNKKQLAISKIHESKKILKDATIKLHPTLNLRGRTAPYEIEEIHNFMGCFLDNNEFVFHGEQTSNDIKKLPKKVSGNSHIIDFNMDLEGRKIQDQIWIYLDEYEYICSAINNKIFDKDTVVNLMGASIVSNYIKFSKYINHIRSAKNHSHKNACVELEKLARIIAKDRKISIPSP